MTPAEVRKPFTTDGCSGGMSWFWRTVLRRPLPWEGACESHDRTYWKGGTRDARRTADMVLATRVLQRGYPIMAALMYYAVRIGGHPLLPFAWRWNYGQRWPRGYESE